MSLKQNNKKTPEEKTAETKKAEKLLKMRLKSCDPLDESEPNAETTPKKTPKDL